MTPGVTYEIRMQVEGTFNATGSAPGGPNFTGVNIYGQTDPTFTVDPSNTDAGEYSIEYSPNINSLTVPTPVPEPSTLGLLGVFGEMVRRAWKGHDWEALNRLHEKGFIGDPVGEAKSVSVTEDGAERSRELFRQFFGK